MPKPNHRPLTVTLPAAEGGMVRDFAQAHKATYASAVCAMVRYACGWAGRPVLEPFGSAADRPPPREGGKNAVV